MEFLTFHVGEREFAVDLGRVREILNPPPITRVPGMPPALLGLAGLRGDPTAVVDAGLRLAGRPVQLSPRTPLIVLSVRTLDRFMDVGLIVEAAGRKLELESLLPWTDGLARFAGSDACTGFADVDDRIILVLDVDQLFAFDRIAAASILSLPAPAAAPSPAARRTAAEPRVAEPAIPPTSARPSESKALPATPAVSGTAPTSAGAATVSAGAATVSAGAAAVSAGAAAVSAGAAAVSAGAAAVSAAAPVVSARAAPASSITPAPALAQTRPAPTHFSATGATRPKPPAKPLATPPAAFVATHEPPPSTDSGKGGWVRFEAGHAPAARQAVAPPDVAPPLEQASRRAPAAGLPREATLPAGLDARATPEPSAAPTPPPLTPVSTRRLGWIVAVAGAGLLLLLVLLLSTLGGSDRREEAARGASESRASAAPSRSAPTPVFSDSGPSTRREPAPEPIHTSTPPPATPAVAEAAPPPSAVSAPPAPTPPPPPPPVKARAERVLPPAMVVTPDTPACEIHEVKKGESLWLISARRLGDPYKWPKVYGENRDHIIDPNVIEIDDRIRVPGACEAHGAR